MKFQQKFQESVSWLETIPKLRLLDHNPHEKVLESVFLLEIF